MKISKGSVVSLEYKLHFGDGVVVDASEPGDPLVYMHGESQIVPGLERELERLRHVLHGDAEHFGPLGAYDAHGLALPEGFTIAVAPALGVYALAVVPQEITLFHRTVRENIRFARPEATDEEVVEAAKVDKLKGMNITFVTSAPTDAEARALLAHLGMPFRKPQA